MRKLSIFVDESGDFGTFKSHSPFYIFTLVFHEQDKLINNQINILEEKLVNLGIKKDHCFHAGPIIRREEDYFNMSIQERQKLLNIITTFTKNVDVKYKTFYVGKKHISDSLQLTIALSKQLSNFINEELEFFQQFDKIILYYDNGQVELNKILATVFTTHLSNVEFRKVLPSEYRLFQTADLICTLELINLKNDNSIPLANETKFFGTLRDFKRNYLRVIKNKEYK